MARDATARLYDVHKDSVVLKKLSQQEKYDQGTITFRARKGRLIDLDKLHESIWATRLSGGTRSGLVSLGVTIVGEVVLDGGRAIMKVAGSKARFILGSDPEDGREEVFEKLQAAARDGRKVVQVTGRLDGWAGRWPDVLRRLPPKPRRILVTSFETATKHAAKEKEEALER